MKEHLKVKLIIFEMKVAYVQQHITLQGETLPNLEAHSVVKSNTTTSTVNSTLLTGGKFNLNMTFLAELV